MIPSWLIAVSVIVAVFYLASVLMAQTAPSTFPLVGSTILDTKPNTILLKTRGRKDEAAAGSGSFYPGSLLQVQSDGTVIPHAVMGGVNEPIFAYEDSLQGKWFWDAFATADLVPHIYPLPGDELLTLLAPGAPAVNQGDKIISNGDGQVRGLLGSGGLLMYDNVADSTAIANTTAETVFDKNFSFPANFFQVGDVIKVKGLVSGIGVTSTPTLRIRLELLDDAGSPTTITIMDTSTKAVLAADFVEFEATVIIRTIGVGGTLTGMGYFTAGTPNSTTAIPNAYEKTSTTIKTTQAQKVQVTATWSAASASNTAKLSNLTVELQREMKILGFAKTAVDNSLGSTFAYLPIRIR